RSGERHRQAAVHGALGVRGARRAGPRDPGGRRGADAPLGVPPRDAPPARAGRLRARRRVQRLRGIAAGVRQGADLGRPPGSVMTVASSAIDVERRESDLRALVRIPSITGSEEAIQAAIERRFAEIGLATERTGTDTAE